MAELFYVIGPSGAGKDSVLSYARRRLGGDTAVAFAHRYITRPPDHGGENHVALSGQEFACRLGKGLFAMHWRSHGLCYGIGIEIDQWLAQGVDVVVNGSRGYLDEARAKYPRLRPLLITAPFPVLCERLAQRGREKSTEITKRLERAGKFCHISHPGLITLDNSGPLHEAAEGFVQLLTGKRCG
jgi:ribose 1,5-bisphosphokinase